MKIQRLSLDSNFIDGKCRYPTEYTGIQIFLDDGSAIRFGIDTQQSCCESWDYLHTDGIDPDDYVGAEFVSATEIDTWPTDIENPCKYGFDGGGYQAIRVVTSVGEFDCVVYNAHNGYYSHAVIFNDTVSYL